MRLSIPAAIAATAMFCASPDAAAQGVGVSLGNGVSIGNQQFQNNQAFNAGVRNRGFQNQGYYAGPANQPGATIGLGNGYSVRVGNQANANYYSNGRYYSNRVPVQQQYRQRVYNQPRYQQQPAYNNRVVQTSTWTSPTSTSGVRYNIQPATHTQGVTSSNQAVHSSGSSIQTSEPGVTREWMYIDGAYRWVTTRPVKKNSQQPTPADEEESDQSNDQNAQKASNEERPQQRSSQKPVTDDSDKGERVKDDAQDGSSESADRLDGEENSADSDQKDGRGIELDTDNKTDAEADAALSS